MLRSDMDVTQQKLRKLLANTDSAFEMLRQHPNSEEWANQYELAKLELNEYIADMRQSLQSKSRTR